jgi:hypothetical protein
MTICKQFDAIQNELEQLQCQKSWCHKSDARNCAITGGIIVPQKCYEESRYVNAVH